ncbi:hypothetical protein ACFYY8_13175, partial [Streptosporangium sp. NPDC001559]|uniref:hypothetical protein n=1 Tax=Streptosporangium sp. NPDC001559 TaxID=3366187 RepID=UPI0036E08FBF
MSGSGKAKPVVWRWTAIFGALIGMIMVSAPLPATASAQADGLPALTFNAGPRPAAVNVTDTGSRISQAGTDAALAVPNRNGKSDLAASWNSGDTLSTAVYLSDGSRFPGWTQWSNRDGGWIDAPSQKWVAGDFNGDRRTDIAAIWNDG